MVQIIKPFQSGLLSVYQSAVEDLVHRRNGTRPAPGLRPGLEDEFVRLATAAAAGHQAAQAAGAGRLVSPSGAAGLARTCAELGLDYLKARLAGDDRRAEQIIEDDLRMSQCDPGWAETVDDYLKYFGPDGSPLEIPYVRAGQVGDAVIEMKPDARVALIGDWGTGTDAAIELLRQVKMHRPDIVIHLGDIYYSGTDTECDSYFRRIVEDVLRRDAPIPVYTLAGNHDMYSGGGGFYRLIDTLNAPPDRQRASFFCLRDKAGAFQFVAMDTGLHDYDPFNVGDGLTRLEDDEADWHVRRIAEWKDGRTILLSHHQLFSAFSQIGPRDASGRLHPVNPNLLPRLRSFQQAGPIAAWFWGHEHNLCIYRPYAGLDRGRCAGHGGIPVFVEDRPYDVPDGLMDAPELIPGTKLATNGPVYAHGFVMIAFDSAGRSARVDYFQDTDPERPLYSETLA